MDNQKVTKTKLSLRVISMMMVLVMTIMCMDLKVSAKTFNTPQETTAKAETEIEIETTTQSNDELSSKSEINKSVKEKETEIHQEKIDSSLYRDDPLAGEITKKATESMEAPTLGGIEEQISLPEKVSGDYVTEDKKIKEEENSEPDFEPGVVLVGFKQSYTQSKIEKQFPKLNIKSTEDQSKLLYKAIKANSTYKKAR